MANDAWIDGRKMRVKLRTNMALFCGGEDARIFYVRVSDIDMEGRMTKSKYSASARFMFYQIVAQNRSTHTHV